MKNRITLVCLGISILISVFLCIYDLNYEPVCERPHLDVIDRNRDIIPDGEEAIKLAEICLGLDSGGEADITPAYDVEAVFNEMSYEWIVVFTPEDLGEDREKIVVIRRDSGAINICE